MPKHRLEAFSDGVIAIIITIMVLELHIPQSARLTSDELGRLAPAFLTYLLSFVIIGIYWNNHHHMLHATEKINGAVLWANLHLPFWLSLFPFFTGWMGENQFAEGPTAAYGVVLLLAAIAYYILQTSIIRVQGDNSALSVALGRDLKGKASPIIYAVGIPLAFVSRWLALACYVIVALIWLIPDRRVESMFAGD